MKFYLAASAVAQQEMRLYRKELEKRGHKVTSRWLDTDLMTKEQIAIASEFVVGNHGETDLADIRIADALLMFTHWQSTTGGQHVEFGYALGLGKPIVLIGDYFNVFQPQCILHYVTWHQFLDVGLSLL